MIPSNDSKNRAQEPTHVFVRNLLKLPDDLTGVFDDLNDMQRVGLALVRISRDVDKIYQNGCSRRPDDLRRIEKLESWLKRTVGFMAGIVAFGTVIGFALGLVYTIKAILK